MPFMENILKLLDKIQKMWHKSKLTDTEWKIYIQRKI